jgi:predicted amidohydrolase
MIMPMGNPMVSAATRASLAWKTRTSNVDGALSRRAFPRAVVPSRERVTVAIAQMQIELVDQVALFVDQCYRLTHAAVERGAQMIVFPEYTWLGLLGILPGAHESANQKTFLASSATQSFFSQVRQLCEATASQLASRFGVAIMFGTLPAMDKANRVFSAAPLFLPDGQMIGTQEKIYLAPDELSWLTPGNDVRVFDLPFARVAILIGADSLRWEMARLAALHDADILIAATADAQMSEPFLALRGTPARAQEACAYGVQACAVTSLFGLKGCGPSFISAPVGMRRDPAAFITRAKTPNVEEIVIADLDLGRVREFRAAQVRDYNQELYRLYLPRARDAYHTRVTQDGKRMVM